MARMIPPQIRPDCASPGERDIFRRLKDDPETHDWIVLHSLDVANHATNLAGEIDFVVIVPRKGVLCLEVKACSSLRRTEGLWYYGSDSKPDARGPFKQAASAMHSIRTRVASDKPFLSKIPFWSAVVFPYVEFLIQSEEWNSWQVIDTKAFRSIPLSILLSDVLDHARRFLQTKASARWFDPELFEPDTLQCQAVADSLRPDFEFFESPRSRTRKLEKDLVIYTTEQFSALDAMESNPRVTFVGPAGTGKTLLAIEAARRGADAGRRVLLVCFNRLLGNWLGDQVADRQSGVVARTLHQHMLTISGSGSVENPTQDFWESQLPIMAIEALLEDVSESDQFDELIVDEAQDILREEYLDFLDMSLRGGLAAGRWRFFGDFENQSIYGAARLSLEEFNDSRCNHAPVFDLRINCRNTPRVVELVHLLGGLNPPYRRILRPDDGQEPEIHYYSDDAEQQSLLLNSIEILRREGFSAREVVILSPRGDTTSMASKVSDKPWSNDLRPFEQARGKQIGYCSVHAFKGMEAPAVVVTDIDKLDGLSAAAVFYVAATRVLQRLIVLVHEPVKAEILRTLMKGEVRQTSTSGR